MGAGLSWPQRCRSVRARRGAARAEAWKFCQCIRNCRRALARWHGTHGAAATRRSAWALPDRPGRGPARQVRPPLRRTPRLSLPLRVSAGAFQQGGDAEARGPRVDVLPIHRGIGDDQAANVAPLAVGDFTAVAIPLQLGEEYVFGGRDYAW